MGKSIAMTAKFSEIECNQIDAWAALKGLSRSAAIHELVMKGFAENNTVREEKPTNNVVKFYFKDDYSYFWKDHEYIGMINGDDATIKFGGEWMSYKLADLPVEVRTE